MIFGNSGVATNANGFRATGAGPMTSAQTGGFASSMSGMLNSPIGGGVFSGLVAGATTYASGGSAGESIGAGVGGMIGGIAGSYFGPVGSMIGATVGSMLGKFVGGMFGKKDKWKKQKTVAGATLGFDNFGLLGVDGTFASAKGKGMKEDNQAGGKLGNAMADAFNDFFLDLGATFDDEASARVQEVYQARVKGKKKKGEKHYFYGSFADEYIGTAETAEQFLPMFLSGSLAVAAQKGLVQGVSDTILTIFKNVVADNGGVGVSDQDEITRMVEFGKFYDRVDQIRTPAQAAAEALKDLNKAMASAKATAEEFGRSYRRRLQGQFHRRARRRHSRHQGSAGRRHGRAGEGVRGAQGRGDRTGRGSCQGRGTLCAEAQGGRRGRSQSDPGPVPCLLRRTEAG
jgi:hypothetical protein